VEITIFLVHIIWWHVSGLWILVLWISGTQYSIWIAYGHFLLYCTWCTCQCNISADYQGVLSLIQPWSVLLYAKHENFNISSIKQWNLPSVEYNYTNKHPAITVIKVVKEMYYILRSCRSEDINPAKLLHTMLWWGINQSIGLFLV
jgi:hypothetical protein